MIGADVVGVEVVCRQGRLNKLRIPNDDGYLLSTTGMGGGGVGRMLSVGGGSGATSPSRSMQRDWIASILLGGASWTPAMVAVSLVVASMILLVAVIFRTGMA